MTFNLGVTTWAELTQQMRALLPEASSLQLQ